MNKHLGCLENIENRRDRMTTIHSIENLLKNSTRIENNSCTGSASDSEQSEMNCPHEVYQGSNPMGNASNASSPSPDNKQNITQEWVFIFSNSV